MKMTSNSKYRTGDENSENRRRKSKFLKENLENVGSYKPVRNKILTTRE